MHPGAGRRERRPDETSGLMHAFAGGVLSPTKGTSSSAWQGIFTATTPKQIYALADEIIGELRRP